MALVNTCKRPKFTYGTASGNPCTFNAGLCGLPLEKLVVSFIAQQSGSGVPSPDNNRPIILISSIELSANFVPVIVPLGNNYAGGYRDLITGKTIITHKVVNLGTLTWMYQSQYNRFISNAISDLDGEYVVRSMPLLCSCYQPISDGRPLANVPNYSIYNSGYRKELNVHDNRYTDGTDLATALSGQYLAYILAAPVEIQLTPAPLSAVKDQNTISGGAEIADIAAEFLKVSGG